MVRPSWQNSTMNHFCCCPGVKSFNEFTFLWFWIVVTLVSSTVTRSRRWDTAKAAGLSAYLSIYQKSSLSRNKSDKNKSCTFYNYQNKMLFSVPRMCFIIKGFIVEFTQNIVFKVSGHSKQLLKNKNQLEHPDRK